MIVETSHDRLQVGGGRNARMGRGRGVALVPKINTKVNLNKHQIYHVRIIG